MIELTDVSKYYGRTLAINALSLSVQENGIYCLLGRNGAGKSTLMKLLAGHLNASAGSIAVNGHRVDTHHMPVDVHFIQSDAAQFNMKLKDLLRAAGSLDDGFDVEYSLQLAAKFRLDLNKRYRKLSFGMKVMVNTILGMASNRRVLLLDEPVLGFDP